MIACKDIEIYVKNKILFKGNAIFKEGLLTVITGRSGSGKTTFLNVVAGMERKYKGHIYYTDDNGEITHINPNNIGFVFQDSSMLLDLTIRENMEFYRKSSINEEIFTMEECLKMVHLDISLDKYVYEISGGQRQRLAIAACLYKNVQYLFLDEPTAYLDNINSEDIIDLLYDITHQLGIVTVVASHDRRFKEKSDVLYEIKDQELILVKDYCCANKNIHRKTRKMNKLAPILYYAKHAFVNRIRKESFLCILTGVLVAFTALFLGYMTLFSELEEKQLSSLTNNELKLSLISELNIENYHSSYEHKIDDNMIFSLKQINKIENIYPFYEFTATLNGNEILIQSYYDNNLLESYVSHDLSKNTECIIDNQTSNTEGLVYFSYGLQEMANENIDVFVNLMSDNRDYYPISLNLRCNKLLEKTYQNQYSTNGENIIYVPTYFVDKLYKNLIEKNPYDIIKYSPSLYLIEYNNIRDVHLIIESIQKINKDLCCFSEVEINELLLLSDHLMNMKESTFYLLVAIILVLGSYYRISLFISKVDQAALIRANGMNVLDTVLCLISVHGLMDLVTCIIIVIILFIGDLLLKTFTLSIIVKQLQVALLILGYRIMIEFIVEYIYLSKKSIQSITRD